MKNMIKICSILERKEQLTQLFKNSSIIPVIGSGFSAGHQSANGIVPNGFEMKTDMLKILSDAGKKIDSTKKFSQISKYYNRLIPAEMRKQYISDHFINVSLPTLKQNFLNIGWPYLFTLNIDDSIERCTNFIPIGPNAELDKLSVNIKPLYKIHGDAKTIAILKNGEDFAIFDSEQYMDSLEKNKWLLNKIKQDYIDKNILFIGCSLDDEIDLMHIFSILRQSKTDIQTEKFYITKKHDFDETELIDLEEYGITTILVVDEYENIYETFIEIAKNAKCITQDDLQIYNNIPVSYLEDTSPDNKSFLLYGKNPYNIKTNEIYLPTFFIHRNISKEIINGLESFPIQIIYGRRISGKTYTLLSIRTKIANKDVYYFDSRKRINLSLLQAILGKNNSVMIY